jgi:hypothetical protein
MPSADRPTPLRYGYHVIHQGYGGFISIGWLLGSAILDSKQSK